MQDSALINYYHKTRGVMKYVGSKEGCYQEMHKEIERWAGRNNRLENNSKS